jgi:hypothetical protein
MNVTELTDSEITSRVFKGARSSEFRGLSDGFTQDELHVIFSDESFKHRSRAMKDWFYSWFDQYLTDTES